MLSEEELAGVPLLVFCNKQDVPGALPPETISEKLGLAGGEKERQWSVRGSCATKGEGLEEGLDWYVQRLGLVACESADDNIQVGQCNTEEIDDHLAERILFFLLLLLWVLRCSDTTLPYLHTPLYIIIIAFSLYERTMPRAATIQEQKDPTLMLQVGGIYTYKQVSRQELSKHPWTKPSPTSSLQDRLCTDATHPNLASTLSLCRRPHMLRASRRPSPPRQPLQSGLSAQHLARQTCRAFGLQQICRRDRPCRPRRPRKRAIVRKATQPYGRRTNSSSSESRRTRVDPPSLAHLLPA